MLEKLQNLETGFGAIVAVPFDEKYGEKLEFNGFRKFGEKYIKRVPPSRMLNLSSEQDIRDYLKYDCNINQDDAIQVALVAKKGTKRKVVYFYKGIIETVEGVF